MINHTMTLRLQIGKTKSLKPRMLDQHGKEMALPGTVTYVSSNPAVLSVDVSGKVTALSAGPCTVTVTCGSLTSTKNVIVLQAPATQAAYTPVATSLKV